mmetsp:Transcript_26713/g.54609  ORF Transcript_26713/g.54609 Transcript_26713/m.54609 type:complete len:89 (+) Transcript_26713:1365-1631(+)
MVRRKRGCNHWSTFVIMLKVCLFNQKVCVGKNENDQSDLIASSLATFTEMLVVRIRRLLAPVMKVMSQSPHNFINFCCYFYSVSFHGC